ncbi:late blight resistance homolog R1A-3 isoform X1 [Olea europaea subsp. europaea]|uniref:Late blight resistance homolog R1A-3 isoform X1 n=1 Tax=Olea europaea subsp. europaea TaxID=158383 RepID=A0A8S0TR23_OLEEU|nr:late blight resistance homolog R1A-3 isoform X1 [Olea europaea subsp. europaea]
MHLLPTKNIVIDIEAFVNEVGSFFYSFLFTIVVFILNTEEEEAKYATPHMDAVVDEVRNFLHSDLFTFLEDLPLQISENEHVQENQVLNLALSDLLTKFVILETKIKEHCIRVSKMPSDMTPKIAVVSLFIVDSVLDDLMDLINNKSAKNDFVNDQITTLHEKLMLLGSSITDIAVQHEAEHEELVIRTIDIACEVEYVINSFPPVWYLTFRLPQLIEKIQLIGMAGQEIKNKIDAAGMPEVTKYGGEQVPSHPKGPPILEDIVVGFDKEGNEIAEQLVRGTKQLQIISIFGMPGLGKTTLANKIYNHPTIGLHFDVRAWCVTSQTYKKRNMLIEILMSISHSKRETFKNTDDADLAQKLYQSLKGRRYLVVIDDIWDINVWNEMESYKHLPMHLKPCFLYFGAFKEDEEIPVRKLISLWIAEGYVKKEEHECIEDVAVKYLMELIDRSMVLVAQRRFDGQVKTCKIHDLLREMCLRIADEKYFLKVVTSAGTYFSESCRQQATNDDHFQINSNLQSVSALAIHDETDQKILRCLHNLRRLTIWFESSLDYSSDFVNQLESLKLIKIGGSSSILINVPLYLKQLTLVEVHMSPKEMEIIEGLPNLEVLKFLDVSFEGRHWDTSEVEFPRLKFLKLCNVNLAEWNVLSDNFPELQQLVLRNCKHLKMIPSTFDHIPTLQMIEVYQCTKAVKESAKKILEEQQDMGNEDFKVIISDLGSEEQEESGREEQEESEEQCEEQEESEEQCEEQEEEKANEKFSD